MFRMFNKKIYESFTQFIFYFTALKLPICAEEKVSKALWCIKRTHRCREKRFMHHLREWAKKLIIHKIFNYWAMKNLIENEKSAIKKVPHTKKRKVHIC